MTGTKAVHQCLFCPQTFGNAVEKDDHILEHFPQETCTDCDQSLIRIGSNLYTIHNAVTCIKGDSKSSHMFLHQTHIDSKNDLECNSSNISCDQRLGIKLEPETETETEPEPEPNEEAMSVDVDPMNFVETAVIEKCQEFTPSNPLSVQRVRIKTESTAQVERFISVDVNSLTELNGMDDHSQSISTESAKPPDQNKQSNYKYKCDVCLKMFQRSGNLEQHKLYTHRAPGTNFGRFECDICPLVFQRKDYLRKHKRMKHDPSCTKFRCKLCYRVFLSESSLDKHLPNCEWTKKTQLAELSKFSKNIQPTDYSRFECKNCKRVFNTKKTLNQHLRMKHNPNSIKFKCISCKKVFVSKASLDNHRMLHCKRIEPSPGANSSNDIVATEAAKIDEENTKSNENDKRCQICYKMFCDKNTALRHSFLVHKVGGHHCMDCKQVFHSATALINHSLKCERLLQQTFECYICHKLSKSRRNLLLHMRMIHVKSNRKIRCEICKQFFSCKASYQGHKKRIHLNLNTHNFVCSTCGATFISKTRLVQHEWKHTGEKPLKCSYAGCDQTFRTSSAKYAHLRMHRGEKKFRCRIDGCNEQFGGVIGYRKHKLNVHGISMTK